MFRIGIAEDDTKIAMLLNTALSENGYETFTVENGNDAIVLFNNTQLDLLILDVMMPGMNGNELCRNIRTTNKQIPILMLTALGTVDDKVIGLEAGADDYLVKPFHLKELLARVNALLRRQHALHPNDNLLTFEDLSLNLNNMEVKRNDATIDLSAKELLLLELFLRNPNRLLSRQYIAEQVWDMNFETGTNVIDVYVNFLRKKIERGFERKLIHTKINMGYILK